MDPTGGEGEGALSPGGLQLQFWPDTHFPGPELHQGIPSMHDSAYLHHGAAPLQEQQHPMMQQQQQAVQQQQQQQQASAFDAYGGPTGPSGGAQHHQVCPQRPSSQDRGRGPSKGAPHSDSL